MFKATHYKALLLIWVCQASFRSIELSQERQDSGYNYSIQKYTELSRHVILSNITGGQSRRQKKVGCEKVPAGADKKSDLNTSYMSYESISSDVSEYLLRNKRKQLKTTEINKDTIESSVRSSISSIISTNQLNNTVTKIVVDGYGNPDS